MECKHSSGVTQRLARIAGQVNGIRDMVEEGRPCDDLLVQLSSASSALTQVARLIMAEHLEHCVLAGFETGDRETTVENLKNFKNEIAKGGELPALLCSAVRYALPPGVRWLSPAARTRRHAPPRGPHPAARVTAFRIPPAAGAGRRPYP